MIVCPNCTHQNPDGAIQCEACYTPLPAMTTCPNCGSAIQTDASFCGQCGFNLRAAASAGEESATSAAQTASPDFDIPDLAAPEPLIAPEPLLENVPPPPPAAPPPVAPPPIEVEAIAASAQPVNESANEPAPTRPAAPPPPAQQPSASPAATGGGGYHTQLQTITARLLHVQTSRPVELPQQLSVIHIGKPNDRVPPDIDVSGFPNSEIVSRIHADIRLEGDSYYIEDVGSSNGTYINNLPLPVGNRHRLRPGDRIALGKGDKMTFLFQLA